MRRQVEIVGAYDSGRPSLIGAAEQRAENAAGSVQHCRRPELARGGVRARVVTARKTFPLIS
jgi:hypothetical protein